MAANQAITFLSLSANVGQAEPGMQGAGLRWLRRLITAASELPPLPADLSGYSAK